MGTVHDTGYAEHGVPAPAQAREGPSRPDEPVPDSAVGVERKAQPNLMPVAPPGTGANVLPFTSAVEADPGNPIASRDERQDAAESGLVSSGGPVVGAEIARHTDLTHERVCLSSSGQVDDKDKCDISHKREVDLEARGVVDPSHSRGSFDWGAKGKADSPPRLSAEWLKKRGKGKGKDKLGKTKPEARVQEHVKPVQMEGDPSESIATLEPAPPEERVRPEQARSHAPHGPLQPPDGCPRGLVQFSPSVGPATPKGTVPVHLPPAPSPSVSLTLEPKPGQASPASPSATPSHQLEQFRPVLRQPATVEHRRGPVDVAARIRAMEQAAAERGREPLPVDDPVRTRANEEAAERESVRKTQVSPALASELQATKEELEALRAHCAAKTRAAEQALQTAIGEQEALREDQAALRQEAEHRRVEVAELTAALEAERLASFSVRAELARSLEEAGRLVAELAVVSRRDEELLARQKDDAQKLGKLARKLEQSQDCTAVLKKQARGSGNTGGVVEESEEDQGAMPDERGLLALRVVNVLSPGAIRTSMPGEVTDAEDAVVQLEAEGRELARQLAAPRELAQQLAAASANRRRRQGGELDKLRTENRKLTEDLKVTQAALTATRLLGEEPGLGQDAAEEHIADEQARRNGDRSLLGAGFGHSASRNSPQRRHRRAATTPTPRSTSPLRRGLHLEFPTDESTPGSQTQTMCASIGQIERVTGRWLNIGPFRSVCTYA